MPCYLACKFAVCVHLAREIASETIEPECVFVIGSVHKVAVVTYGDSVRVFRLHVHVVEAITTVHETSARTNDISLQDA